MVSPFHLATSLHTDPGQVRDHNEDYVDVWLSADGSDNPSALLMVADGVGGAEAGEIASRHAVERVMTHYLGETFNDLSTRDRLRQAVQAANDDVRTLAAEQHDGRHMATTAVVAVVENDHVTIANVGDSRAYHVRDGDIRQLTRDHSLVAQLVAEGAITEEEALTHPRRNIILYSLGSANAPRIDMFELDAAPGDMLVLCSDGLTRHVSDAEIVDALADRPLEEAGAYLVDTANERGGYDNISVVLLRFDPGTPETRVVQTSSTPQRVSPGLWLFTLLLAIVETMAILALYLVLQV